MRADFADRGVVEFKYVLNQLVFLRIDRAVFAARFDHEHDLFLGGGGLFFVRPDPEQAEHAVCGDGQQPYEGGKKHGDKFEKPGKPERHLFRAAHGDPLGDQFAEYDAEVRENQRNDDDADGVERSPRDADPRGDERVRKGRREVIRGESAPEQARERDCHLDGGEKLRRAGGQLDQPSGALIARLRQFFELVFVGRNDRDFRAGENRVQKDQYYL